jgi:hypothetical protein
MEHVAHKMDMTAACNILDRKILIGRQLPKRDPVPCSAKGLIFDMLGQLVLSFIFRH